MLSIIAMVINRRVKDVMEVGSRAELVQVSFQQLLRYCTMGRGREAKSLTATAVVHQWLGSQVMRKWWTKY